MRNNRSKTWMSLVLCLIVLSFSLSLFAVEVTAENARIEDFVVEDIPGDTGNGLVLKWKPLPNNLKILEYRVYRGIAPDSLFYLGSVALNPVVGFAGTEVSYSDSGFKPFVDKSSPGRLVVDKKVKSLDEKTNYFGTTNSGHPRDLNILSTTNGKYDFIAQIEKNMYYARLTNVELDGENFAGYPLGNVSILARPKAGVEYFYSVVPINENRKYLRPSNVVSATPISDPMFAQAKEIYTVLIKDGDAPLSINFDWNNNPESYSSQQAIYLFEGNNGTARSYFEASEEAPYTGTAPFIFPIDPQVAVYQKCSQKLVEEDGVYYLRNEDGELAIDLDKLENYTVAIQTNTGHVHYIDENSREESRTIQTIDVAVTPRVPEFEVYDLPNDKGDTQVIVWEKPTVEITKTSFYEKLGRFLIVNYDFFDYEAERLDEFDLTLTIDGHDEPFFTHNEFYLDNIIKVKLPEDYVNETIHANVTITTHNSTTEPYSFQQELEFDEILKALIPSAITKDGVKLNTFNYEVYAKEASPMFTTVTSKVVGKLNNYRDVISYERFLYEPLVAFDTQSKRVLVPSNIQVWFDAKTEKSLYLDKFAGKSKEMIAEEIIALEEEIDATDDANRKELLTNYHASLVTLQGTLDGGISNRSWIKQVKKHRDTTLRQKSYKVFTTNNRGLFASYELPKNDDGTFQYFTPISNQFDTEKWAGLIASLIFGILVAVMVRQAKQGKNLYIRPIAGIQEIDNAIGRATEMGRPILFVPGMSGIGAVATLAALSILGKVAKKAAEYDTRILVPTRDYILMPIAQEIVKEAHVEAGRPDTFDKNSVFFITTDQFAYVAGVNGIMIREKTATNFYMGSYFAESLLMTETGNITGAIQIAGTDSVTQIPFFITTCDYTLIGEELYAASAYMSKEPMILGTLKAQDYFKFIVLFFIILGTILSSMKITLLLDIFPQK